MKSFVFVIKFQFGGLFLGGRKVKAIAEIRRKIIVLAIFLLFSSLIFGQNGVIHQKNFIHNGTSRAYILYEPNTYTGQEAWPLVINYHGHGSNADNQMSIHSLMNIIADTSHYLVAYPRGLNVEIPGFGTRLGWNVPGYNASHDDVSFTDSLIGHVKMNFNIDSARIHATGYSNGSQFAFYLAYMRPDKIASVAGVAGPMTVMMIDSFIAVRRPFSTLLIHGTADPIIPFNGVSGLVAPAPTTPSFWAAQNNCSPDSIFTDLPDLVEQDNCTVTLIEFTDCDPRSEVLFYRVDDGGHTWPGNGNPANFLGNVNRDINASSVILNFFKRNPHPDLVTEIADHDNNFSKTFRLHQNYPNPFNPTTNIGFTISDFGFVELSIYDISGRLVKTLMNESRQAGEYSVQWDATNAVGEKVASGVYFYRLKAGSFVETRKMLLIR